MSRRGVVGTLAIIGTFAGGLGSGALLEKSGHNPIPASVPLADALRIVY